MPHSENDNFSAPSEEHDFSELLFDMDGTIIDSTDAIVKFWRQLGKEIGVDGDLILQTSHGRRTMDVLEIHAPQRANWDFVCKAEGQIPVQYGADVVEVPGSRSILDQLTAAKAPWAIVTSGTKSLITGWLKVMKLAQPKILVSAEEVEHGKPDPTCYLVGSERLKACGMSKPGPTLVLEDATAGVRAGKAAGFKVVALATTHDTCILREAGADWIVKDMRSVRMSRYDSKSGKISIEIRDALVA